MRLPTELELGNLTGGTGDPNEPTLGDAVDRIAQHFAPSSGDKLAMLASGQQGNLAHAMSAADLAKLGVQVVEDYRRDKEARKEWEEVAEAALKSAAQDQGKEDKTTPWPNASNVHFPLLTSAALQFNARMYPAVVKGDEAVLCKVIGQDNGKPVMGPNPMHGAMQPMPQLDPNTGEPIPDEKGQIQPQWLVPPGAKAKRARRVSEYLNTILFYRMPDWEEDTDALLMQLPVVGCVFRKIWFDASKGGVQSAMVPALRLLVPDNTRNLSTAPRITEEIPDVFPHQIRQAQREGRYLDVDISLPAPDNTSEDDPRLLLEQHRLIDIDDDGLEEPYIVTVDHKTEQVLRIEANFDDGDIRRDPTGKAIRIEPRQFYIKFGMFPHPEGKFYDIGLGHLLKQLGGVIDTAINQLMDAGTAQTAGGGFIGSGVRLQGRGNRGVIRLAPGEYKTVEVTGDNLRSAIVERTLPNVSPVTFQVLDMIMGAARDITGAKDVITGEASNTGQVGTTLALIEQGLQVFNAVAKRIFRSLKDEYELLAETVRKYGGQETAQDYLEVLDDPDADFAKDFNGDDMDIRPVSDPAAVTRMQKMARAQYLQSTIPILASVGGDAREALRRSYEAADLEDIDKLLPPPQPPQQDPMAEAAKQAQVQLLINNANKSQAQADKASAEAAQTILDGQKKKYELEHQAIADGVHAAALDH